ncbi:aldo/keto reductase [Actinomadura rugatobispora]|uniref:Aldo/keto reductase n=1 Tax=Actinomadura rugatobispora TaxID=1994 RepID=A0ABW1A8G9_9ACTN|nr:aldo/keto reductase [Actinomadura rugatobispora]
MELRRLGRSGLYVSEFALGAMTFGMKDWGCDEDTAVRLVDRYLDAGGNFLDTADGYPGSEEICGRALKGKRSRVVVATKFGMPTGRGPHDRGGSRINIRRACERSLRRLGTDYIDLYQLHVDDEATPLEETVAALDDLVRAGKVLYVGASNLRAYRLMKALAISDRLGAARFVSFQGQYNLIVRTLEREHVRLFAEEGLGLITWSPLAAGMLTGKLRQGAEPPATRLAQREVAFDSLVKNDRGFGIVDLVRRAAARIGCTPAQLALAWQRTRPVTATIVGARTERQLEDNLGALHVRIPAEILDELDQATAPPPEYPGTFIDIFQGWLRGGTLLQ